MNVSTTWSNHDIDAFGLVQVASYLQSSIHHHQQHHNTQTLISESNAKGWARSLVCTAGKLAVKWSTMLGIVGTELQKFGLLKSTHARISNSLVGTREIVIYCKGDKKWLCYPSFASASECLFSCALNSSLPFTLTHCLISSGANIQQRSRRMNQYREWCVPITLNLRF